MSRRSLLSAFGVGAAGVTLTGCGVPAAYVQPGDRAGRDFSAIDHALHFTNWPLYIDTDDEDESKRPTLDERSGAGGELVEVHVLVLGRDITRQAALTVRHHLDAVVAQFDVHDGRHDQPSCWFR